jgi:hypothetical protein
MNWCDIFKTSHVSAHDSLDITNSTLISNTELSNDTIGKLRYTGFIDKVLKFCFITLALAVPKILFTPL